MNEVMRFNNTSNRIITYSSVKHLNMIVVHVNKQHLIDIGEILNSV